MIFMKILRTADKPLTLKEVEHERHPNHRWSGLINELQAGKAREVLKIIAALHRGVIVK